MQNQIFLNSLSTKDTFGFEEKAFPIPLNLYWVVQKAYDKIADEFIAIKKFKKISEDDMEKKKFLEEIMVEDELLQNVEKIRVNTENCHQYFLKDDGVFREANDQMGLILKMESGCATLDNILEAGKVFSCAELLMHSKKCLRVLQN